MVEDYVIFKSRPLHYYNEKDGTKANTVRHIDEEDARFKLLREGKVKNIKIVNSVDGQFFIRPISNRTEWEGLMIISWSHYEPKKRWINFKEESIPNNKTRRFIIKNKENDCGLGRIQWDTGWRQYIFTDGDLKLAEGCLYELFEKVKALREEREHSQKG